MSTTDIDRSALPLDDWRSTRSHNADDCNLEVCDYCGCCVHGRTRAAGCKVEAAPFGMNCPNGDCGCEGRS